MNGLLERFLRYSLSHRRPIRVMLLRDGLPASVNLTVTEIDERGFYYLSAKNKQQAKYLGFDQVLAAAYARGDQGEGKPEKDRK